MMHSVFNDHNLFLSGGTAVQTPTYMDAHTLLKDVSKDLPRLLDEGSDHDVEFICGDEVIKAHKNVLCCRSEVFSSMLRSDMVESETGQIKIQNVEGSIFRELLRYLYTGVFPELTVDVALQLYDTAVKYAVGPLKAQCTSFLTEYLSHDNACEILIIADRHSDPDFKKVVMEYVIKEEMQFMKEKWTDLCKKNPILANEVLNLFCQNVHSK